MTLPAPGSASVSSAALRAALFWTSLREPEGFDQFLLGEAEDFGRSGDVELRACFSLRPFPRSSFGNVKGLEERLLGHAEDLGRGGEVRPSGLRVAEGFHQRLLGDAEGFSGGREVRALTLGSRFAFRTFSEALRRETEGFQESGLLDLERLRGSGEIDPRRLLYPSALRASSVLSRRRRQPEGHGSDEEQD